MHSTTGFSGTFFKTALISLMVCYKGWVGGRGEGVEGMGGKAKAG